MAVFPPSAGDEREDGGGAGRDGRKVKEANKDTDPRKEKRVTDKLESAEKKRRQEIYRFRAKIVCGPCCRDVVHGGELSFFISPPSRITLVGNRVEV